jgi:hypothetical protein
MTTISTASVNTHVCSSFNFIISFLVLFVFSSPETPRLEFSSTWQCIFDPSPWVYKITSFLKTSCMKLRLDPCRKCNKIKIRILLGCSWFLWKPLISPCVWSELFSIVMLFSNDNYKVGNHMYLGKIPRHRKHIRIVAQGLMIGCLCDSAMA